VGLLSGKPGGLALKWPSARSPTTTWNATHIALRLKDKGAAMVGFRQDFRCKAPPTGEFAKLIV
jgi:hypothetical protein